MEAALGMSEGATGMLLSYNCNQQRPSMRSAPRASGPPRIAASYPAASSRNQNLGDQRFVPLCVGSNSGIARIWRAEHSGGGGSGSPVAPGALPDVGLGVHPGTTHQGESGTNWGRRLRLASAAAGPHPRPQRPPACRRLPPLGEPVPGRGGKGRVDVPGWHRRAPAGLCQGGRDQGAGQPGQQSVAGTSPVVCRPDPRGSRRPVHRAGRRSAQPADPHTLRCSNVSSCGCMPS